MALIDVATKFGKFLRVTEFEIVNGQEFTLFLTPDKEGKTRWFWEHDQTLETIVDGNKAKVKATALGNATLYIYQGEGRGEIIMQVDMRVVEAVLDPAAAIVGTVGPAVPKRPTN